MSIRTLIIALLAVAALAGCGRRGVLEGPPGAEPVVDGGAAASEGISPLDPGSPAIVEEPVGGEPPAPERRFFLDFLL